ncbi:PHD finger protein 7-like, partial [Myiozetetes cayanensis]|uniref:PHD finger protein 7-like n=1 Tax=Myiozetetes cayanensis TaxID=478635 RepID=UPI00215E4655
CGRSDADPDIYGEKVHRNGLCAHEFCLSCCICGQSGATITCCETDCDLSFHLPCAKQGGCVTQFIRPYRSFCPTHSPEQEVEATPEPGTNCLICMEPVEDRKTFKTMVCPACKTAWFHRDCIQGQALHAGFLSLQCPLCRNRQDFLIDMFTMGIRIPFRPPSWMGFNAFADLGERHRHCDASECLFPGGREEAEEEGPWELLLCSSCAAEGTHRHCSGLRNSITRWECDGCAGLGTASRDDSELAGPSTARQSGLEPSEVSREPETISPNTGSLELSGLSPSSPTLDTISPSTSNQVPSLRSSASETSNLHTNPQSTSEQSLESPSQEMSSSSPDSQVTSGSSHSSFPDTEDSSCSSGRRPDRRRNHSRRQRRARSPQLRSRSPHNRTHVPEPSPGRRRPRLTQSGESRRRNRSRLQSQTPNPSGQSRSLRDRSHKSP